MPNLGALMCCPNSVYAALKSFVKLNRLPCAHLFAKKISFTAARRRPCLPQATPAPSLSHDGEKSFDFNPQKFEDRIAGPKPPTKAPDRVWTRQNKPFSSFQAFRS